MKEDAEKRFWELLITTEDGIHGIVGFVIAVLDVFFLLLIRKRICKMEEDRTQDDAVERMKKSLWLIFFGWIIMCIYTITMLSGVMVEAGWLMLSVQEDALFRSVIALTFGVLILVIERIYEDTNYIKKNRADCYVEGVVVGTHRGSRRASDPTAGSLILTPGYKRLVISYRDPMDGQTREYKMDKPVRLKKHPIGSTFLLSYSQELHFAYDDDSERMNPYLRLTFLFLGWITIIAGIMWLLRCI